MLTWVGMLIPTFVMQFNPDKWIRAVIDTAVCRVLRMKFEMGLFEHPYVDPKIAAKTVRRKEHIELARKIAQSSITLLKN